MCYRPPFTSAEQLMNFIDALEQDSEVSYEPYKVGDLDMAGIS